VVGGRESQSTAGSSADSSYRHSQRTPTTIETELEEEEEYQNEEEEEGNVGELSVNNNDSRHSGSHHTELPPPLGLDIVAVLANQNHLIEELARGNQNSCGFMQGKMSEFMRIRPPIFDRTEDPLEADSWL